MKHSYESVYYNLEHDQLWLIWKDYRGNIFGDNGNGLTVFRVCQSELEDDLVYIGQSDDAVPYLGYRFDQGLMP